MDRARDEATPPNRRRCAVPGAPPDGREGLAGGGVGPHRRGAPREVLPSLAGRQTTAHRGARAVEPVRRGRGAHSRGARWIDMSPARWNLRRVFPVSYTHLRAHETPEHLV